MRSGPDATDRAVASEDESRARESGADETVAVNRRTTWGPDSPTDEWADEPIGAREARSGETVGTDDPDDTGATDNTGSGPSWAFPDAIGGGGETTTGTVEPGPAPVFAPGRIGTAAAGTGMGPDEARPGTSVLWGWEPLAPGRRWSLRPGTNRRTGPADGAAAAAARRAASRSDTTMAIRPRAPPDGANRPGPPTGARPEPPAGVGEPATASGRPGMLLPVTAPGGPADRPDE